MSMCFRQKDAYGRWCTNASLWTQKKTVPESSRWDFLVTPTDKEMESSILVRWLLLIMRLCILWNNIYLFQRWASTSTTITTPQTTPSSTWSPSNLKIFPGDSQIQICLFLVKTIKCVFQPLKRRIRGLLPGDDAAGDQQRPHHY